MRLLIFVLSLSCFPAAFTSKATGNWSSGGQTTWNEVGVPGAGDTASIGAHTVTVDVNTTIGTSPNNNTTKVVEMTSGSGRLIIGAGVTFTILGNRGSVNSAVLQQDAGSTVTFDNSASGGSPVYEDLNEGFTSYVFNGTAGNLATIQAISGQTFKLNNNWAQMDATYFVFRRASNLLTGAIISPVNMSDGLIDQSSEMRITISGGTNNVILDRITFTSGTGTTDLRVDSATYTSGTRRVYRCVLEKLFETSSLGFSFDENYFGGGLAIAPSTTTAHPPRLNMVIQPDMDTQTIPFSSTRNYYVNERPTGNPHFIRPTALLGADNHTTQSIFESQAPDLVDIGDAFLFATGDTSGGNKTVGQNNIVLKSAASGNNAASGTLVTLLNVGSAFLSEWYRNTVNVNDSSVGGLGKRGAVAVAEGGGGFAGQVAALKSNVAWGSSASQGCLGERVSGTTLDIITAAGADYNWKYNLSAGDNQRSYEDKTGSGALWTAGDAVAAGVGNNDSTTDPQFVDSARNCAAWATARGYGSTYASALTAIKSDVTRTADLINYVFEGFKVSNSSMRTSGYDGAAVGAANYAKPGRTVAAAAALKTAAATRYGVSF